MRFFLFFLIALFSFGAAQAKNESNHFVLIYKVEFDGKPYSLAVVMTNEKKGVIPQGAEVLDDDYVEGLIKHAENWMVDQYVVQERMDPNSDFYRDFTQNETLVDERSSLLILTEYNDLSKIRTMMRVAKEGDMLANQFLPLEIRTKDMISRDPVHEEMINGESVLVGGLVEWKNFVKFAGVDQKIVALLFWRAVTHDFFGFSLKKVMWKGKLRQVLPEYIVGETDGKMVDHYVKVYGFEVIRYYDDKKEGTYIIKVKRDVFIQRVKAEVARRLGPEFLTAAPYRRVQFNTVPVPGFECVREMNELGRQFFQEKVVM
jgi:hypothetical protein